MRALPVAQWHLPDPREGEPGQDVIALGGGLDPGTVITAYTRGLFPMNLAEGPLAWWSPDPRGVLPLDALRVSRTLRRSVRRYACTIDRAFADVVHRCAAPDRPHGWITPEISRAYIELHALGFAHSVEVWNPGGDLVGGLYGVEVGGLFAGESMFHLESDASKVALVHLVETLRGCGGVRLLDVQWCTDHLASLGAIDVPRELYLDLLAAALPGSECLTRP